MFFQGWRDKPAAFRLPFIYNMTAGAIYTYAAAFKKFGAEVFDLLRNFFIFKPSRLTYYIFYCIRAFLF